MLKPGFGFGIEFRLGRIGGRVRNRVRATVGPGAGLALSKDWGFVFWAGFGLGLGYG